MDEEKFDHNPVGPVPSPGVPASNANAGSGDPAYKNTRPADVGRVPPHGVPVPPHGVPVPSHGVPAPATDESSPRRLRRLHRVWPDRDGNISYLLTLCVDGRTRVLDNEETFQRLVAFLLDSPTRYRWFGRRFVVMPDHIHLIAHMGHEAVRLGQWVKALKAVVGGLKPREERPVGAPGLQDATPDAASGDAAYKNTTHPADVGRVPSPGVPVPNPGAIPHEFSRVNRAWRWQEGFHDHKFRTPESESRKWEYICLNPVRYGLVRRPEEWSFGGEIFYDEAGGPRLIRGTPPLLEAGMLIEKVDGGMTPGEGTGTPGEGTRPTT